MSLLVVGSVAIDSVETPTEKRENVLGGAAVFFSYSASYFTPVRLVGIVGEDWPPEHTKLLKSRNIDMAGLHTVKGGKTFFWRGKYLPNMNDRETLEVHLNVFGDFEPVVPPTFRESKFLFLANAPPMVQMKVMDQVPNALIDRGRHDGFVDQHSARRADAIVQADRWVGAERCGGEAVERDRQFGEGRVGGAEDGAEVRGDQEGGAWGDVLQ